MNEMIERGNEFLKGDTFAVIGAKDRKEKWGYKIYNILKQHGYEVIGINPKIDSIDGDEVYDYLYEVDVPVDGVVFIVNPEIGKRVSKEVIDKNIKMVWMQPGAQSEELIKEFEKNNIMTVHDHCIKVHLTSYH